MSNTIVTENVSILVAPTPTNPQKKGALISQGATTLAAQSIAFLTQLSDLTPILKGALALTSLVWSGSVVTATTTAPHGVTVGHTFPVTVTGATPAGYNTTATATSTGASTFTYPLVSNPGLETVPGVYTPEDVAELVAMVTTFFAMGNQQGVWVLELGIGSAADGVAALTTYLAANGPAFYIYIVPRFWDADSAYLAFLAGFESNTSRTYFFTTTTIANYTSYTAIMKCVVALVEAPGIPATEFSLAAAMFVALNYTPGPTNRVTPFAFSFLFGVTAYPTAGNAAILQSLKTANVNVIGTGAEGQISRTILNWGTTKDGNDFTFWYSVDWMQFNTQAAIANEIINGSNSPANPLYYNQEGINRLQGRATGVVTSGVADGLVLGPPVQTALDAAGLQQVLALGTYNGKTIINAVPFLPYITANPADFPNETYSGLTVIYSPNRGFRAIVFNILVESFVAGQ